MKSYIDLIFGTLSFSWGNHNPSTLSFNTSVTTKYIDGKRESVVNKIERTIKFYGFAFERKSGSVMIGLFVAGPRK